MGTGTPFRVGLDVRLTYYTQGGIAKYIRRLAAALPDLAPGHAHVHFYRRGHQETFSAHARRVDCWTPAHHRFEGFALGLELAPHRLDLLHSPDFVPPRWGYRRSIITVHDLAFLRYPRFLTDESRRYYHRQIQRAVKQADAISADSQATRDDLVHLLSVPSEKATVIHLGLDSDFRPLPPEAVAPVLARLGLLPGYVLFVGTFEPRKNVPGLLAAYARLRRMLPAAPPLVLVGNRGWLFDEADAVTRDLALERHVRLLEGLPAADLPAVYNGAGVFALVSYYEGFGFPVLEAMGCGVPCVIADRASLPEIAGEAALRAEPDDADAIAAALYRSLTDATLRHGLRERGLERAKQFTWEKTARETLALYERVLG
jgi:glycosyltransferase involved in cell wall biosynthesis